MAGSIFWKERAVITLTSTGASLTSGSGALVATLDVRSAVAGNAPGDLGAIFDLLCQWATVTGIAAGTVVADLYLVASLDGGTTWPDVDTTAGSSYVSFQSRVGSFSAPKAPTANVNMLMDSNQVDLFPVIYRVYIINRSGQTISANWTLRTVPAQMQYS